MKNLILYDIETGKKKKKKKENSIKMVSTAYEGSINNLEKYSYYQEFSSGLSTQRQYNV